MLIEYIIQMTGPFIGMIFGILTSGSILQSM